MQNMSFHSQRWENIGTQTIRQDHWSFYLYLSQYHLLHNLHSLQKVNSSVNSEQTMFLRWISNLCDNKQLMTGPKGNSEFCFPETLKNIEGRVKTKLTVPRGFSHLVFCFTSRLKNRKRLQKHDLLDAYSGCARSTSGSRNDTMIVR